MTTIHPSRVSPSSPGSDGGSDDSSSTSGDLTRRPTADSPNLTGQLLQHASTTELIFAMQVFSREQNKTQSETAILGKKDQMENALRDEREAIKKHQSEENDKAKWGGIKGKLSAISTVALVAASAASVVVSGGVSAPLAVALVGMAISLAAKPVGQATGNKALEMGMTYGGAALSLAGGGASALGTATRVTTTAASAGATAGSLASSTTGAVGAAGTSVASTATSVAATVQKLASVAGGVVTVGQGVASYEVGHHEALATRAQADSTEAGAIKRKHAREMDDLIELLKEAEKSFTKAKSTLRSAAESQAASNLVLATMGVRA